MNRSGSGDVAVTRALDQLAAKRTDVSEDITRRLGMLEHRIDLVAAYLGVPLDRLLLINDRVLGGFPVTKAEVDAADWARSDERARLLFGLSGDAR